MAGGTIDLGLVRGPNQITTDTSTTISGILKGDGSGHAAAAAAGTDYVAPSDLATISATGTTNATGATIYAGTYFYLNGVLVQAKTDIASGATFTLNTNYSVGTAGALNELKSALYNRVLTSSFTIPESSSIVFDVPAYYAGLIATSRSSKAHTSLAFVTFAGVDILVASQDSYVSYSFNSGVLTVTNSNHYSINIYVANLSGDKQITEHTS